MTAAVIVNDSVLEAEGFPTLQEAAEGGREYVRMVELETDIVIAGPRALLDLIDEDALTPNPIFPNLLMGAPYKIERPTTEIPPESLTSEFVDEDVLAICFQRTPTRDESRKTHWTIELRYNTKVVGKSVIPVTTYAGGPPTLPTDVQYIFDEGAWDDERPIVELRFVDFIEAAKRGRAVTKDDADPTDRTLWTLEGYGAIANSAGDPFLDPAPEVHTEKSALTIIRNVNKIDIRSIFLLMNSVNTEPVQIVYGGQGKVGDTTVPADALVNYTIPRFGGRIAEIWPELQFRGGRFYYRMRYQIDIFDNTEAGGTDEAVFDRSWVEQFLDRGFLANPASNQPQSGDFAPGELSGEVFEALNNLSPQMEVLLDGDGGAKILPTKLNANGKRVYDLTAVSFVNYLLYDSIDWRSAPMFKDITNNVTF